MAGWKSRSSRLSVRVSGPAVAVAGEQSGVWCALGYRITLLELPGADHGLQQSGDWRRSLLDQVENFDRVSYLAGHVLAHR